MVCRYAVVEQHKLVGILTAVVNAGRSRFLKARAIFFVVGRLKRLRLLPAFELQCILVPSHCPFRLLHNRDEDAAIFVYKMQCGPQDVQFVEAVNAVTPIRR